MSPVPLDRIAAVLEREGLLVERRGDLPAEVGRVTDDSRTVEVGDLFVAIRGSAYDGHDFVATAGERGAAVAIVEQACDTPMPYLIVRDARAAAALSAAVAYDVPARALRIAAVTGTNGKTTTVGMLRHLLDEGGARGASIGTLGVLVGSEGDPVAGGMGLTTPGPVELQRVLRVLADAGVRSVAMETSSHSLDQRRVEGIRFDAAVFTNLTRDHLDYHGTMDAYLAAKALLIQHLKPDGAAVVNADDPLWAGLPAAPRTVRFAVRDRSAQVRAEDVRFTPRGSVWTLCVPGETPLPVELPLIGGFNISNALAASAAAWAMGGDPAAIAARLSTLPQVPGRLEILHECPLVLRDYAHTPDALERAMESVRPFTGGRLVVLFGCGGDRDRGKRPEMGAVAGAKADVVILTSDNPRTEDPERILDDIAGGMSRAPDARIEDRRTAIEHALDLAAPDDVVLLAGKGHETYQIRGTVKQPFDEREIVAELVGRLSR